MPNESGGCRFIKDAGIACGAECREGSPYCVEHHARCYLTPAEAKERQREYAALAKAVGGKFAPTRWRWSGPSREELERLERNMRDG